LYLEIAIKILTTSMNKTIQVAKYLIFDFLAAAISWTLFLSIEK
jgi:hypothetical protein